ncbi:hypothetical protein LDENG_00084920 [Lucifuga dentata]|nr:hypothetical protein LDENG_00084920 [Lucifuga dentata]
MDPLWPWGVGPAVGPLAYSAGGALLVSSGGIGVGGLGMGMGAGMGGAGGVGMGGVGGVSGVGMGGLGGGGGTLADPRGVVMVEGCGTEGCEDCEREMDEIDYILQEEREGSLC